MQGKGDERMFHLSAVAALSKRKKILNRTLGEKWTQTDRKSLVRWKIQKKNDETATERILP
jgi:hypothetical protein